VLVIAGDALSDGVPRFAFGPAHAVTTTPARMTTRLMRILSSE